MGAGPLCDCEEFWPGQGHPDDCPTRRCPSYSVPAGCSGDFYTPSQRPAVEYVVNALRGFCGFDNIIDEIEDDGRLEEFLSELSEACPRLRLEEI